MIRNLFLTALLAVSATLAGCGGGAPPTPSVTPPANLIYDQNVVSYAQGQAIPENRPHSEGGAITHYTVDPQLPAGLVLDPGSGVISGTPSEVSAAASYTVTGSNAGGSTATSLRITVVQPAQPPGSLNYTEKDPVYTVNTPIAPNDPNPEGGAVSSYSVSPGLPAGLTLNTSTGVITGTPTAVSAAATYTVTAQNSAGSVSEDLTISVVNAVQPPAGLAYKRTWAVYGEGKQILPNTPSSSGGPIAQFSIEPPLPAGMTFDTTTGEISGKPIVLSPETTYTIVGSNAAGQTHTQIQLQVVPRGTWVPVPTSMKTGHYNGGWQFLLPNGQVLVLGGKDQTGALTTAVDLYDPDTGVWSSEPPMSSPHYKGVAALVDGKVLVASGQDNFGTILTSAEMFDPATHTWSPIAPMQLGRLAGAAISAAGQVIVAGGSVSTNTDTKETEIYDPASNTWTVGPDLSAPVESAQMYLLDNNSRVLVAGGYQSNIISGDKTLTMSEWANVNSSGPAISSWTQSAGPLTQSRYAFGSATLSSDVALAVAGVNVVPPANDTKLTGIEQYSAASDRWTKVGDLPAAVANPMVTRLDDGTALIAGGTTGSTMPKSAMIFNPSNGQLLPTGSMNSPRYMTQLTTLNDGNVLVSGGQASAATDAQTSSELYVQ